MPRHRRRGRRLAAAAGAARTPDDLRGVFAIGGRRASRRADYAWAAGGAAPELLWLLGRGGPDAHSTRSARQPPAEASSRLFADGGYAVMRSGWGREAPPPDLRRGAARLPGQRRPWPRRSAQRPVLAPSASRSWWIPGRYATRGRDLARLLPGHRRPQHGDGRRGRARPTRRGRSPGISGPRARLRRWLSTDGLRLRRRRARRLSPPAGPVSHRRRVLFVKPRLLGHRRRSRREPRSTASISASSSRPRARGRCEADAWARAHAPRGHGLLVRAFAAVPLKAACA